MKTYLESEETKLLEISATNPRDRLLIRLLSRLGCRVSEALALTVEDVDFQEHTITIQHLKTRLKLACPHCSAKLAASHVYCPGCGLDVEKAVAQPKEHLGHISFNTTAKYRKISGDEHRQWYQQLWHKDVQDKLKGGKE